EARTVCSSLRPQAVLAEAPRERSNSSSASARAERNMGRTFQKELRGLNCNSRSPFPKIAKLASRLSDCQKNARNTVGEARFLVAVLPLAPDRPSFAVRHGPCFFLKVSAAAVSFVAGQNTIRISLLLAEGEPRYD